MVVVEIRYVYLRLRTSDSGRRSTRPDLPGRLAVAKPGDEVRVGDPVLDLHYRDRGRLDVAVALATRAIGIGDHPPASLPLILGDVR